MAPSPLRFFRQLVLPKDLDYKVGGAAVMSKLALVSSQKQQRAGADPARDAAATVQAVRALGRLAVSAGVVGKAKAGAGSMGPDLGKTV